MINASLVTSIHSLGGIGETILSFIKENDHRKRQNEQAPELPDQEE
jgi:hypothetical protein